MGLTRFIQVLKLEYSKEVRNIKKTMQQKRLIFIILSTCLLVTIFALGINQYYQERKDQKIIPADTIIDILSLPGWERLSTADLKATVKYYKDDKIWRITNPGSYLYVVGNNRISLKAAKPFEVRVKIETRGISYIEDTQLGFVRLYNSNPLQQFTSWLEIGSDVNYLRFNLIDLTKPEKERFQPIVQRNERIAVSQGIVLGIKIEDDDNALGEKVTIYDCDTGEIFKQTNLPNEFFKNKIFFGFESGNVTDDPQGVQMEIGQFSVVFPGRDAMSNLIFK